MAYGRAFGDDFLVALVSDLYDKDVGRAVRGLGSGARQVLGIAVVAGYGVFADRAPVGEFDVALPIGVLAIVDD